jgi:NAD(P)-dependent dehydrogenase (short-subunit alcohol dehydrogenase family)
VITGASSGLGRALAVELASRRASILMADVDEKGAEETARLVEKAGGKAFFKRCDVRDRAQVIGLLDEADRALGGVDVLMNNAGVSVGGLVGQVPLDDWAWVIDINLFGVIYGCHAFVPRFKEQQSGAILNVASAAGLMSIPKLGPYNVTKAGVVALSETLRGELTDHNVAVTVLCPTFFQTKIASSGRTQAPKEELERVEKRMAQAKVQADGVARYAVECLDKGRFYALPHEDGRWSWRLKRAAPGVFVEKLVPSLARREMKR